VLMVPGADVKIVTYAAVAGSSDARKLGALRRAAPSVRRDDPATSDR
jgi:hypothetical protein